MRILSKLVAGAAVAATSIFLAVPSALADPPPHVTPHYFDAVGVGSSTTTYIMDQISVDYNDTHHTHNAANPWLYSWDAAPTSALFVTKQGCKPITRQSVNGSSAGVAALAAGAKGAHRAFCVDFGRSSRARKSTDPKLGPGGVAFVTFARDAITYATRIKAKGGTNAPANLTTADLTKIYSCTVTNWKAFGGKNAKILAILPQNKSGTYASFLSDIGVTTPGPCVNISPTVEENEGINPVFNSPNAIFPMSIGRWLAQQYRSPKCLVESGSVCVRAAKPGKGQNLFGAAINGFLGLNSINGTKPTTGVGSKQVINPRFTAKFFRFIYNTVRYSSTTPTHIPAYLERFFNPASARIPGYMCANKKARADIVAYGFLNTPFCGAVS